MPELPEVETLKRELARVLVGKKFQKVEGSLKLDIVGRKVIKVERRAKILIFKLHPPRSYLLTHLKMTGQLTFTPQKYTRAIFTFSDSSKLFFNDLRKFGWIKLVNETKLRKILGKIGVEPLEREFTRQNFGKILARFPKRKIKPLLLDQTLIAGLGNIYADESCFRAKILPTRIIKSLTPNNIQNLRHVIIAVLKLAISKKGTSARDYVRSNGQLGGFVPYLKVYGRQNEKCKKCGTLIKKIKLAGRGTHFCPHCQR